MKYAIALALLTGMALWVTPSAQACGGHEARAADCLEQLFGEHSDAFSYTTHSHKVSLTLTGSGEQHTTDSGTEDAIVEDALDWLGAHGIAPGGDDCQGDRIQSIDVFENAELCG